MSWREYLPYHKEPRYFSLISVPVAVILAAAGAQIFRTGVSRTWKLLLGGFAGIVLVVVVQMTIINHRAYVDGRDFIPRLIDWLEKHPAARLWTRASIQNELDLRFGYRFSDPVHNHAGQPGYGSVMDASFWHESRRDGDWILVQPDWRDFSSLFPAVDRRKLKPGPLLSGQYSAAMLYQLQPFAKRGGMYYLSDDDPLRETHSFAPPRWDFSFDSTPIIINGVHYKKGIGVHSRSEIAFRIDPQYPVFSAELGLEDSAAGEAGSVVFSVYADETLKYRSPVMRSASGTETVRLDLTGAAELRLVVDEAEDGNVCDHAAWGNPLMSQEIPAAGTHEASGK